MREGELIIPITCRNVSFQGDLKNSNRESPMNHISGNQSFDRIKSSINPLLFLCYHFRKPVILHNCIIRKKTALK